MTELGEFAVAGDVPTKPLRDGALLDLSGFVFKERTGSIFDELIAPILTPPEPKDWSAKRRFKAVKKSSKQSALFASMLNRI